MLRLGRSMRVKYREYIQRSRDPQASAEGPGEASETEEKLSDLIAVEESRGKNGPIDEPRPPESVWLISIKEKLQQADQYHKARSWAKHSIYQIPHNLRDGEDNAYVPQVVSLGPYHHYNKRLRQMDQHKWRCLRCILSRTNHKIDRYLDSVKKVEERARACYEETISMNSEEFVEMMVLDGCFVIELLWGAAEGFNKLGYPSDDPVFSTQGSMYAIQWDIIMLENQIPLFILDLLLSLQVRIPDRKGLVAKLALRFFDPMRLTDGPLTNRSRSSQEVDLLIDQGKLHCLDLFRWSLLHPGPRKVGTREPSQMRQQLVHCVTELRKAGIQFRRGRTDRFWDIQFKHGILWIPRLQIDDGTRSLLLNLMAFEQCHFNCGNDITSYVTFMDNLINSPEDVGHLRDCKIIEHWLGSDTEVADLFNRLCKKVVFDINNSYLSKLSEEVNIYSGHRWNGWIASLQLKYFSNPWSIISLVAAFVLLVLAFMQTFYGVYGYYRPRS